MSFGQEIKDFLDAYDTVSTVMTNQDRTRLLERQTDIDERYKTALTRKIDYEIGAEGRENDAIVESIDDPYSPFRTSSASGGGSGGGGSDIVDVVAGGGGNTDIAMNYFVNRGLSPIQASGLVGNLMAESGTNLNTGAVGDGGASIGILQAQGDRRIALENAVPDWQTNLQGQLDFIWGELNNSENSALRRLQAATTPEEAAAAAIGYERPQGWTPDNPQGGHNFSGRLAYTQGLAEQYASLTPEGIVTDLPGVEANAFDVPEGGDIDQATGPGDGADQLSDPLSILDPDYVAYKEERGYPVPPGEVPGAELTSPAELVPEVIEPVVTPPPIAQGDAEAVPEQASAIQGMGGIDPLPQTSGHMDQVARAGSPDEVTGDAAVQAMGDADPEPKGFMRGVLAFGRKMFGLDEEGIDTDESPQAAAYDDGVGGAPVDLIQRLEEKVDPNRTLTNEARMMKVMSVIWNFKMRQGDVNGAYGSAFAIYQTYKVMRDKSLALAQVAAEEATTPEELAQAVEQFTEAYSLVPDGEVISATPNEDGTFTIEVKDAQTGEVKSQPLNIDAKTIVSKIMNITPDQFDDLVEERILGGEPEAPDVLPGAIEEMYPEEEPPVASPDGAVLETVPGPPGPMGETAIPPDQAQGPGIYEEEGIQVASADPNAPTGDPTTTPLPKSVETRPEPGAVAPPMTPREFAKFILPYRNDEEAVSVLTALWNQDNKLYEEYLKTLPTEAEVDALAAYNTFFEEVRNTPNDEFFDTSQSSIAGIGDEKLMGIAQRIADARNEEYKRILTERAEADKAGAQVISTNKMNELLGGVPQQQEYYEEPRMENIPGAIGDTDWGPLYGAELDADPTRTYGLTPGRAGFVPEPTDGEMDALLPAERNEVQEAIAAANARGAAWDERFKAQPLSPMDEDAEGRFVTAYNNHVGTDNETGQTPGVIDNVQDATVAEMAKFMRDDAANTGKQGDVLVAARIMMDIPKNAMAEQTAVETAWAMMTFNPYNPEPSLFVAERADPALQLPHDTLAVYRADQKRDGQIPAYIPENMFRRMDMHRQDLADKWMDTHPVAIINGVRTPLDEVAPNGLDLDARARALREQAQPPPEAGSEFSIGRDEAGNPIRVPQRITPEEPPVKPLPRGTSRPPAPRYVP